MTDAGHSRQDSEARRVLWRWQSPANTWLQTKRRPVQIRAIPATKPQLIQHQTICGSRFVSPDVRFWEPKGSGRAC